MDAPIIDMLTEEQLQELLEIRSKMTALQARYNEIISFASGRKQPANPASSGNPAPLADASAVLPPQKETNAAEISENQAPKKQPTEKPPLSGTQNSLKQAIVNILIEAGGTALPFNTIYSKLEAAGASLPETKPMLVVRKLLYDREAFLIVKGGLFKLRDNDDAGTPTGIIGSAGTPAPSPLKQAPSLIPIKTVVPDADKAPKPPSGNFTARLDAILNR